MSVELGSERVCYVHCNFCNTILAVNVPNTLSLFNIVTVRCGHCANLLSVNMGAYSLQTLPASDPQLQKMQGNIEGFYMNKDYNSSGGSSSTNNFKSNNNSNKFSTTSSTAAFESSIQHQPPRLPPIRPPEKRQRVPSAYNRFIKEEIQRIKASNPDISHREAFSTAAKNWAHFPHIHFGLKLDGSKQPKLDQSMPIAANGTQKSNTGMYQINGTL